MPSFWSALIILIRALSNLSGLFPLYTGRRHRNIIWYYCGASLLIDLSSLLLKERGMPFQWLTNVFVVLELVLVGLFLDRHVFAGRASLINKGALTAVLGYFMLATLRGSPMLTNMERVGICYIYFIVVLLAAFLKTIREMEYVHIQRSPQFVFYAGFFIYSCGVTLIFLFEPYLANRDDSLLDALWLVLNFLNILKHGFIGYYFVLKNAQR